MKKEEEKKRNGTHQYSFAIIVTLSYRLERSRRVHGRQLKTVDEWIQRRSPCNMYLH